MFNICCNFKLCNFMFYLNTILFYYIIITIKDFIIVQKYVYMKSVLDSFEPEVAT